jgi:FkbM family methyltransferase
MINRGTVKYTLKKILPKSLFKVIHFFWQTVLLQVVEMLDEIRLKKFTEKKLVSLTHHNATFLLTISPSNGFIDEYIYLYGVYESFMLDVIKKYLKPGMTFIDIGANIGEHSMYAAALVGKEGSVYAFEPIPYIYEQLLTSSQANHFESIIHAKNVALGEHASEETLYISSNVGGSSLIREDETTETIKVTIVRGDDELLPLARIDMVKIDVEGYEYEVLSGMKETLANHHPVILIEFSGELYLNQAKDHGRKILEILESLEYSIYDIEDDMHKVTSTEKFLNDFIHKKKVQTNLLCVSHH